MRKPLSGWLGSLAAIALLGGNASAGTPANHVSDEKKIMTEQTIFVTGSLIPQRIKLKRIGTASVSPLRIIDHREIEQTGRRTTQGALIIDPSVRVTGH